MYTVYQHRNKINKKVYIGITSQKPENRWRKGEGYKNQRIVKNLIKFLNLFKNVADNLEYLQLILQNYVMEEEKP